MCFGTLNPLPHCRYESKTAPFDSPERFRVEIQFSPGANYNPFDMDIEEDHVLPPVPRIHMEDKEDNAGLTLASMEGLLRPMAKTSKFHACQSTYAFNPISKVPSRASTMGGSLNNSLPQPQQGSSNGASSKPANGAPNSAGLSRLGRLDS
jgi:hypothetical protein